ncbi:hypothetical protein E0494_01735 [Marinilabiliaceae bacterium JC040]|nr:hypothetical protein [Marinilabiliaceae bacterium JC040]
MKKNLMLVFVVILLSTMLIEGNNTYRITKCQKCKIENRTSISKMLNKNRIHHIAKIIYTSKSEIRDQNEIVNSNEIFKEDRLKIIKEDLKKALIKLLKKIIKRTILLLFKFLKRKYKINIKKNIKNQLLKMILKCLDNYFIEDEQ